MTRKEKNKRTVENSNYNYIYLKKGEVFHRRTCKLCLNTDREILGSVYYETSAEGRRPCKVCKPVPDLCLVPISDSELAFHEVRAAGTFSPLNWEVITAKMITGEILPIRRGKILGWCHYSGHPGTLNKALMKEHECVEKCCRYFNKNSQSPYWRLFEEKKKAKEERKAQLREEKTQKMIEKGILKKLSEKWQEFLDETDSDMYIVNLVKENPEILKVYYVSGYNYADGNRYPDLVEKARSDYPGCRILLRHIRDIDGHFVTTDEFRNRRKK